MELFKVEEAMLPQNGDGSGGNAEGAKMPQYLVTLAATMLVFSGGAVIGWSAPALPMLENTNSTLPFHTTPDESSWIGALLAIGALIGAFPAGSLADMLGRKMSILVLSAPLLLSWGVIFFAGSAMMLYAARLIAGIGLGAICTIVPMYIAEIAEDSIRGTLCSSFQLMLCCGILFTYTVGAGATYYQIAAACSVLPVIFIVAFFRAPETPVFLLKMDRRTQAEKSLRALRGSQYNTTKELHALENELNKQGKVQTSFMQALSRREAKLAITISLGMMFCQQLSGINIVIFYASKIFKDSGSTLPAELCTILVGLAQVVSTLVSMVLIDRAGRKILLQISAASMAVCLSILGYYFLKKDRGDDVSSIGLVPVAAVIIYILLFAIGFGPIPWMMSGEVLPADIKGVCTGIAVSLNWTLAFIVTKTFKMLTDNLGNAGTYFLFAGICVAALLFSTFVVIETKGKSLQEVQDELAGRNTKRSNVV
uniref:Facilitated trehalose transporter Tret1 n=1 Tax=Lygus hesperus TaxID=30085 RepID=A0A146LDU6_LYGHE